MQNNLDLSKMSDEELEKLSGEQPSIEKVDLSQHSDEDLEKLANGVSTKQPSMDFLPKQSIGSMVGDAASYVGKQIDRYTGAPTREALTGKNPIEMASKFFGQIGEDPDKAITPEEMAIKAGARPGVEATLASIPIGAVADWTNLITPTEIIKGGAKALGVGGDILGATAKATGKAAAGATDILSGAKIGEGIGTKALEKVSGMADTVRESTKNINKLINYHLNPKQAENFPEILEMAKRQGVEGSISPALEFGKESSITQLQKHLAENPVLGEELRKQHKAGLDALNESLEQKVRNINKGKDPSSISRAGEDALKDMEAFKEGLIADDDLTLSSIYKGKNRQAKLPVNKDEREKLLSMANGLERKAKGLLNRGSTELQSQGKSILAEVEAFRRNFDKEGNISFKNAHEFQKGIQTAAFPKSKGISREYSEDLQAFRDLYFGIRDSLIETVKKDVNPEWADEILKNNEKWSNYKLNEQSLNLNIYGTPSEKFVEKLFSDSKKIDAAKQMMSPEMFDKTRQSYISNRLKNISNADESTRWSTFNSILKKEGDVLEKLYSPEEMQAFKDLAYLGANYGDIRATPTGPSLQFMEMIKSPIDTLRMIKNNAMGVKSLESKIAKARSLGIDPTKQPLIKGVNASSLTGREGAIDPRLIEYLGRTAKRSVVRENPLATTAKNLQTYGSISGREKDREKDRFIRNVNESVPSKEILSDEDGQNQFLNK